MQKITGAILGAAVVIGGAVLMVASGRSALASTPVAPTSLTVTGTSTAESVPTGATVMVGVQTSAADAATALAENDVVMRRVVARLEALGIPTRDLATNGLNIYPETGSGPSNTVTGYQVVDGLTVTVPSLGEVGTVLDDAVRAGANQVNGVTFTGSHLESTYVALYRAALNNARVQATALATALHEHVVGIEAVHPVSPVSPGPVPFQVMAPATASTPIFPGQNPTTVSLVVTFRVAP